MEGLLTSLCSFSSLSPRGADITVETDMLLSLLQSTVADPESEALARKVSCKPSLCQPWEVRAVVGHGLWHVLRMRAQVCPSRATWLRVQMGTESQPTLCWPSQAAHLGTSFPNLQKAVLRAKGGRSSEPLRRT